MKLDVAVQVFQFNCENINIGQNVRFGLSCTSLSLTVNLISCVWSGVEAIKS